VVFLLWDWKRRVWNGTVISEQKTLQQLNSSLQKGCSNISAKTAFVRSLHTAHKLNCGAEVVYIFLSIYFISDFSKTARKFFPLWGVATGFVGTIWKFSCNFTFSS
jgi:hypothetical protein